MEKFLKTLFPLRYEIVLTVLIVSYEIKLQWGGDLVYPRKGDVLKNSVFR